MALDFGAGGLGLTFFGGEPLLAFDLVKEVAAFAREACLERRRMYRLRIATNATLLDEPAARWLVDNRFDVQVSLDGLPEAHDRNRRTADGHGSYQETAEGLARLRAAGGDPLIQAVVTPSNLEWLPESVAHLEGLGVRRLLVSENPHGSWDEAACDLFERQLDRVGQWYGQKMREQAPVRLEPLAGLVERLASGERAAACHFGKDLAVAPSGTLYPCSRLVGTDEDHAVSIGDVSTGVDAKRREALVAKARVTDQECRECEWRTQCNYGCACAAYTQAGRFGGVTPLFCWMQRCWMRQAAKIRLAS